MHIIFKLRIGFMIVKRETWLNNTQRYRAHIYIYVHAYIYIMLPPECQSLCFLGVSQKRIPDSKFLEAPISSTSYLNKDEDSWMGSCMP